MKKYIVRLNAEEREKLQTFIKSEKTSHQKRQRARILLKADQSNGCKWLNDEAIAQALDISIPTIERTRRRCVEDGFEACLASSKRLVPPHNLKVDGEVEAQILMITCSEPPSGRSRWTLKLIADQIIELELMASIGKETVRRALKKMKSSHGRKSSGA